MFVILSINLFWWKLSRRKQSHSELNDILLRGQAELAGRISQLSEHSTQEQNKMDSQQADALLDLMSQDEKVLRDAIKSNRNRRVAPVEKDW